MQQLRTFLFCLLLLIASNIFSQQTYTYDVVNIKSYGLYEKSAWKELINYGRKY